MLPLWRFWALAILLGFGAFQILFVWRKLRFVSDSSKESFLKEDQEEFSERENGEGVWKVAILFLVHEHLTFESLWTSWITDALEWSSAEFRDERPRLSLYLHSGLPTKIKNSTLASNVNICESTVCTWGHTTPCMHRLLDTAVKADTKNQFFIFVSDYAVPVKPFGDIYRYLSQTGNRSQIELVDIDLPGGPKHSQWMVLSRQHSLLLSENPQLWATDQHRLFKQTYPNGQRFQCSDDETFPLRALLHLSMGLNNSYVWGDTKKFWEEINDGSFIPPPRNLEITPWEPSPRWTFSCWGEDGCVRIGKSAAERHPWEFVTVDPEKFERLFIRRSSVWFARKFSENCFVENMRPGLPLGSMKHQGELLGSWLAEELHRRNGRDLPRLLPSR